MDYNNFYKNTDYKSNIEKQQSLLVEHVIHSGDIKKSSDLSHFKVILKDPLVIDEISDIYLDSFSTIGSRVNTSMTNFLFYIDEFNIKSKLATSGKNSDAHIDTNFIYIPNNATSSDTLTIHKGKKMNFVSTVLPQKITELNCRITTQRLEEQHIILLLEDASPASKTIAKVRSYFINNHADGRISVNDPQFSNTSLGVHGSDEYEDNESGNVVTPTFMSQLLNSKITRVYVKEDDVTEVILEGTITHVNTEDHEITIQWTSDEPDGINWADYSQAGPVSQQILTGENAATLLRVDSISIWNSNIINNRGSSSWPLLLLAEFVIIPREK
tara:strand:- start:1667 stop:2653 length:987 start_codon:yes stop_codon:yes gene_type:complete